MGRIVRQVVLLFASGMVTVAIFACAPIVFASR
jgi:hypothetical protein